MNLDNSGKWCKRCGLPIQDVFIDIKSNANTEIYKIKIDEMMLLCEVKFCLKNYYIMSKC